MIDARIRNLCKYWEISLSNASEEGLLMSLNNPSHTDDGRVSVPLGIVAFTASMYLLWLIFPSMSLFWRLFFAMGAGSGSAVALNEALGRRSTVQNGAITGTQTNARGRDL